MMKTYVFWIDSPESLHPRKDTGLAFMKEAQNRGYPVYYLSSNGLSVVGGQLLFGVQHVVVSENWTLDVDRETISLTANEVDVLVIRKDPPFDETYLRNTWLLDIVQDKVLVSNNSTGIRTVNEKLWVTQLSDLTPQTLVTSSLQAYSHFLEKNTRVVLKPYDSFGGQGVCVVDRLDVNRKTLFELLSRAGTRPVIVQEYLEAAKEGDKRVLLLNGDILGAVLRKNTSGDPRNNLMAGGEALSCGVSDGENYIVEQLKPYMQHLGLHFVGLDFIGDKLIEVNVTSPTCLREMNRLNGTSLETKVLDFWDQIHSS